MEKRCYNCNELLSKEEVIKGQEAIDKAIIESENFEGWVHCTPDPDQMINSGEAEEFGYMEGTVVICTDCVEREEFNESGEDQWLIIPEKM